MEFTVNHFVGIGFLLALIAFSVLYLLQNYRRIRLKLPAFRRKKKPETPPEEEQEPSL